MTCERVQELLLTDYIDGQLSAEVLREVEEHLDACERCRNFRDDVRRRITAPLKSFEKQSPPEGVWLNIKSAIFEEEQLKEHRFDWLRERLSTLIKPVPVFAIATATAVVLVALFVAAPWNARYQAPERASMLSATGGAGLGENSNFGTAIERYFL